MGTGVAQLDRQGRKNQRRNEKCRDPSLLVTQKPAQHCRHEKQCNRGELQAQWQDRNKPAGYASESRPNPGLALCRHCHLATIETGLRRGVSSCEPVAAKSKPPIEIIAPASNAIKRFNNRSEACSW